MKVYEGQSKPSKNGSEEGTDTDILPVKLDYLFKLLFGDERNKEILASFLSAVLEMPLAELAEIQFMDTVLKKEHAHDKFGILDVNLKTKTGTLINVEIQVINKHDYEKRTVYYTGKRLIEQLGEGDPYTKLNQTISINILDFDLFTHKKYHSIFYLMEATEHVKLTDIIRIDFLELQKARKVVENGESGLKQLWMDFFNAESEEELTMLAQKDVTFKKPVAELLRLSGDGNVRDMYEARQQYLRDRMAEISYGESQGEIRGLARGRAEGRAEGLAEGRAEGLAEGERMARLSVARNMKSQGLTATQIASITGLTNDEIDAL